MGDVIFDLRLDLFEGRRRLGALVLDLDDVPAELGLHRIGNLALVELECDLGEFRHHLLLGEIAEIAAFGRARVLRLLLGERGEIGAPFSCARIALASSSVAPGCGARAPLPRSSSA